MIKDIVDIIVYFLLIFLIGFICFFIGFVRGLDKTKQILDIKKACIKQAFSFKRLF